MTANNQNIDYSDTLNIKEDSRLYAVAADMDIFNSINKLKDYTNLLNESLGTYSLCLKLDKQMSEKGKCEPKDLKELLSVILDSSLDIVNSMPGSNIFSKTAFQSLKSYILTALLMKMYCNMIKSF